MTNNSEQLSLINGQPKADNVPVVCLGITFENEEARSEYFSEELRKKLPELKQIEGFPIGEDEDIIALSDPPYYTACPNPWIKEVVAKWNNSNKFPSKKVNEPLAVDISEGKNDPIYNAHTYHTKVPYKAIMNYMLYYTNPDDIVYDGFCGTGMTGVAAEKCGDEELVQEILGENFDSTQVGKRNAVLIDLAPAATFIAKNLSKKVDIEFVSKNLLSRIQFIKEEYEWAFSTIAVPVGEMQENKAQDFFSKNKKKFGKINYTIFSEIYTCPSCSGEINYWEATVKEGEVSSKDEVIPLHCPNCSAHFDKRVLEKVAVKKLDPISNELIAEPKVVPVRINYTYKGKRYNKKPDQYDLGAFDFFETYYSEYKTITPYLFPEGVETSRPIQNGLIYFHQSYTRRNLAVLDSFVQTYRGESFENEGSFLLGSTLSRLTKYNRYMPKHNRHVGPMANAIYLPPLSVEINPISQLELQLNKLVKAWEENNVNGNIISTQSSSTTEIEENSIDYIFIDPPFGANIMYSELSFTRECWLKVFTNNKEEAIENKQQNKDLDDYTDLITKSFKEAYRILKPDKWITVEFSNTKSSVWNSLQNALQRAGFVIASVKALDKKRGGFHAMITPTAVKQDLIISAYKPSLQSINMMKSEINTENTAWTFINQHLEKLPVFEGAKGEANQIPERTPRILFDRMIAYHVQTGLPVPISAPEFQEKVAQRYMMRDGMVFLESQIAEYDKKRILAKDFSQLSLFISDENSAIEWIRQQLMKKPQTRQDLHTQFMKEIQHIAKHEQLPELDDLLVQNFLRYEGDTVVPDQIAGYLRRNYREYRGLETDNDKLKERAVNCWYVPDPNKQADLEKLREKSLLREFESYVEELGTHKKKLSHFRTEAVRAGFKKAWTEKDYNKIVNVGDRLPETVIQEDDKLLMYYDNAQIRIDM